MNQINTILDTTVSRIISGGQTGADRAGLEIAKDLGIETGGQAPKGFLTENGLDLSLKEFGVIESTSSKYPPRTRQNVLDSDGTAVFGNITSRGCRLTVAYAEDFGKQVIMNPSSIQLKAWIKEHSIKILNIAGNRLSKKPGIDNLVRDTIREALCTTKEI